MRIAVVSPHLDDACFSVAEHMLSRPDDDFTIVCPIGGVPRFGHHEEKYLRLLSEHRDVCERTGWKACNGLFYDDAAVEDAIIGRLTGPPGLSWTVLLNEWLAKALDGYDEWWVPCGIHHPDHVAVNRAIGTLVNRWGRHQRFRMYEELPYRVLYPGMRIPAGLTGFGPAVGDPHELLAAKQRLCRLYASQIGPDIERCLYAPERLWEVSS